jgi:hypothetical protein
LPVTPFQRLRIQVRHIPKRPPREEIALHEANKTLDLALLPLEAVPRFPSLFSAVFYSTCGAFRTPLSWSLFSFPFS